MSLLADRLQELSDGASPSPQVGDGLYVVVVRENREPIVAAFADEALADELAEVCGGEVFYEPAADNDAELLFTIIEQYS